MSMVPEGSVIITPTQMYAQIVELTTEVRALRSTVDPAMAELRHDVADHEKSIRELRHDNTVTRTQLRMLAMAMPLLITIAGLILENWGR